MGLEMFSGSVNIAPGDVWKVLSGGKLSESNSYMETIIIHSRLPRIITALFAGSGLAISGLLLQSFFRNPLAGPGVLGISSGSSLGVSIVVLAGSGLGFTGIMGTPGSMFIAAILGAFAVLMLILLAASRLKDSVSLLILGLMIGYLSSGLVTVLQYGASDEAIKSLVFWGMGTFSGSTLNQAYALLLIVGPAIVISLFLSKSLNAMLLGEQEATALGVNYSRLRLAILLITSIITGMVTATCGPIAFLGLAVPHLVRVALKTANHKRLIPAVILTGAALALLCDLLSRIPWWEQSIPLNAITSLIGAPIVLAIILQSRKLKTIY